LPDHPNTLCRINHRSHDCGSRHTSPLNPIVLQRVSPLLLSGQCWVIIHQ
jgi:hypothetical protein